MDIKSFKVEIDPTLNQKQIIHKTLGVCRFIYNFYIAHNKEIYMKEKGFISGMKFSKWLNNEFIPYKPEYNWIKDVSSKAVKQSIMNGEKAFKSFFKGKSKFPKFKKKNGQNIKVYFPKNNITDWTVERHKIKIPTLGYVKLKEKGYIPVNSNITSGTVSYKAGRYYVSVLIKNISNYTFTNFNEGIGIDLGIKEFAVVSNFDKAFKNINKTEKVKKIEQQLKREQRKLSRKYESFMKKNNNLKKEKVTRQNISKQIVRVQRLFQKLSNIREDYINQIISEIVKTKPSYITIEDLNVRGMMKNKHLAKAISKQCFSRFRIKLTSKCKTFGIELRVVDRFYPSSKLCSCCGKIMKDLKLSDRVYKCECGLEIDRDKNASINLANAKVYKVA